jgi:hypothetical protein
MAAVERLPPTSDPLPRLKEDPQSPPADSAVGDKHGDKYGDGARDAVPKVAPDLQALRAQLGAASLASTSPRAAPATPARAATQAATQAAPALQTPVGQIRLADTAMSVSVPRTAGGVIMAEYRGPCALCGLDVTTAHQRKRDVTGMQYVHVECFEAQQALPPQVLGTPSGPPPMSVSLEIHSPWQAGGGGIVSSSAPFSSSGGVYGGVVYSGATYDAPVYSDASTFYGGGGALQSVSSASYMAADGFSTGYSAGYTESYSMPMGQANYSSSYPSESYSMPMGQADFSSTNFWGGTSSIPMW